MNDYRLSKQGAGFTIIKKSHAGTNPSKHFHRWWEILFIVEGQRTFFYQNRTFHIESGSFICIPPGTLHRAINVEENCILFNIYFADFDIATPHSDERMKNVLPLLEKCTGIKTLVGRHSLVIKDLFERIGNEFIGGDEHSNFLSWNFLGQILVEVLRSENQKSAVHSIEGKTNKLVASVIDWINVHFNEEITLSDVAERFGVTPSHLSRSFTNCTRFSFIEYLNSVRISMGCKLLVSTTKSVLDIALSCGFGSLTQFERCFKSLAGQTPREYRLNLRKG